MIMNFNPTAIGPGVFPENFDVTGTNRALGSMVAGDFVVLDLAAAGTGVTSVDPGGVTGTSIWNSFVAPNIAANQRLYHMGGVVLVSAAVGNEVKVRMMGIVPQAFIIYSAGNMVIGDPMVVQLSGGLGQKTLTGVLADGDNGGKAWGLALQAITTPTVRQLAKVAINGVHGFGTEP